VTVSKRLRYEVLLRDGHRCRYCGATTTETRLVVDHVIPEALGGLSVPENLVAACEPCNSGKSSTRPGDGIVADVYRDALRWAKAIEEAAHLRAREWELIDETTRAIEEEWGVWTYGQGSRKKPVPKPDDWAESIERFVGLGLDGHVMARFIRLAMRRQYVSPADTWAYFCGCCWNEVERLQGLAKRALDREK
jgi:hypothetical protein